MSVEGIQMSEFKCSNPLPQCLFANPYLHRKDYKLNDIENQFCLLKITRQSHQSTKYPLDNQFSGQEYENSLTCRPPGFLLHASGLHVASEIISIQMVTALTDWKRMEGWWMMKMNGVPSRRMSLSRNGFQGRSSSSQWAFPSLCFRINHVNLLIFKFIHF